jgi:nucleotide-binding universal stress UspA family protein
MSYVDRVGADAIVVPAIGRDQVRNTVLGSMAEHVIKHARCPVLTTRPEWQKSRA